MFFPYLWQEMDEFWNVMKDDRGSISPENLERVEPTWLALIYSVMGIAVHQMNKADALAAGLSQGAFSLQHGSHR